MRFFALLACTFALSAQPAYEAELIFPLETIHNHSSSIVELPNGDLLAAWFHGTGERTADDVVVMGARRTAASKQWSKPFLMADVPDFPDCNPLLYLDSKGKLWLFWAQILANDWHTALMKYKTATDYSGAGAPKWDWSDTITLIPRNMLARTQEALKKDLNKGPIGRRAAELIALASDKYFSRVGWFTRARPMELPSGRMLVPMYSDGYSFGIMAITDDGGKSWQGSEPIVGYGGIQPTLLRKKDGTLVAWMRDNGPPPKRVLRATSNDDGLSWTAAEDTDIPNPGSSLAALNLKSGRWLLVYNNSESGRDSLVAAMSDDEGATWKWKRHLEKKANQSFHYPMAMQSKDGAIHLSYSVFFGKNSGWDGNKSIKHARIDEAWIEAGEKAGFTGSAGVN